MIAYHGLPINPQHVALEVIRGGHAFVSWSDPHPLGLAVEVAQSFAIDNGAFPAWRSGKPTRDWAPFYEWAGQCARLPSCDFAVIPDVIDGTEAENDALLREWPHGPVFGAPVWHLHESLDRLARLLADYPRVCLGSSGAYSMPNTRAWWERMALAMMVCCDLEGRPLRRLHGLRMLNPAVFTKLPLASADSTNIARNVGIDSAWKGTYLPATKTARALVMRGRCEAHNAPPRWGFDMPGAMR